MWLLARVCVDEQLTEWGKPPCKYERRRKEEQFLSIQFIRF